MIGIFTGRQCLVLESQEKFSHANSNRLRKRILKGSCHRRIGEQAWDQHERDGASEDFRGHLLWKILTRGELSRNGLVGSKFNAKRQSKTLGPHLVSCRAQKH